MQPKILIIGFVWPEPCSSAAGVRTMELIEAFLQQKWKVIFASPATRTDHMINLESLGIATHNIEVNSHSFDDFVSRIAPDIVLFDRFMMEEQFGWRIEKKCPGALRILDTSDLHFLRDARHQALKQNRTMTDSDLFSDMAKREIASIYRSDLTLLISEFEMELLKQKFAIPETLIHHTPFMFEKSDIVNPLPAFEQRQHFITIGNFRHTPNWDSVLWLKQEIWPLIRKRLPETEMHIFGSYPPKKATQLHEPKNGFMIRGWAPDALEVMKQARVCLAPLRFGAGIKGKLADAMLAGTPSVTTPIGAEAMTLGGEWCGYIEEQAEDFAEAAVRLYSNPNLWIEKQKYCFKIISQLFNKNDNSEKLISRIMTVKNGLKEHRLHNFTGAMLRHHHHRSTEFMSRWIEAKNRAPDAE